MRSNIHKEENDLQDVEEEETEEGEGLESVQEDWGFEIVPTPEDRPLPLLSMVLFFFFFVLSLL